MDPFADDKYAKFRQQSYPLRAVDCVRSSSCRHSVGTPRVVLGGCIVLLIGAIGFHLGPFHSTHSDAASVVAEAAEEASRRHCSSALPLIRDGLAALAPGDENLWAPDESLCDDGEAQLHERAACAARCLRGDTSTEVLELRAAVVQLYRTLRAASPSILKEGSLPGAARRLVEREVGGAAEDRDSAPSAPSSAPRGDASKPEEKFDAVGQPAAPAAGGDAGASAREVDDPAAVDFPVRAVPTEQPLSQGAGPAAVAPGEGSGPVAPAPARPHLRHSAQRGAAPRKAPADAAPPSRGVGGEGETLRRRAAVRRAMQHAWAGYRRFAWGKDSLKPVSKRADSEFVGMALTAVDALDTLQLMDLRSEYGEARQLVVEAVRVRQQQGINLFETTIRVVGGLLAASHLESDDTLLHSAAKLADAMSFAFETQTGLPFGTLDLRTRRKSNPSWSQRASTVSEVASLQVEWQTLARLTGNATYAALVDRVTRHLDRLSPDDGLYPMFISPDTGRFSSTMITLGARADSLYEYLLKQWLLDRGGEAPQLARRMYAASMEGVRSKLLAVTAPSRLAYIAERRGGKREDKMDHLVCFVPGMLLMGAHDWREAPGRRPVRMDGSQAALPDGGPAGEPARAVSDDVAAEHRRLAQQLARTCYEMYRRYPSGLAPELVHLRYGGEYDAETAAGPAGAEADSAGWRSGNLSHALDFDCDGASHNLLRPETVESLFYMWRFTRDPIYREWGWQMFRAFEQHARVPTGGYSSIKDVRNVPVAWRDHMESFWLGETLKYFYLLFADDDLLPLDKYVLNTEAHPLPMVGTTAEDARSVREAARRNAMAAKAAGASQKGPG